MDILAAAAAGAQPVPAEVKQQLVGPFTEAVTHTFAEMACLEVTPRGAFWKPEPTTLGEVSAALRLSGIVRSLVLGFDQPTAQALAERVLAGLPEAREQAMQYDCLGEVANVVAGQAKALLAETPYHFYFSTPTVIAGVHKDIRVTPGRECLILGFGSDLGDFALQVFVKLGGKTDLKLGER